MSQNPPSTTTSTEHGLAEATYLDSHFLANQPEYEAILRFVGIQPGWHVLDAGCGGGSFLPLMAELVGAGGKVSAVDIAPENVAIVEANARAGKYACQVEAKASNVTLLPYKDQTFDAIWSANVAQYLTIAEFSQMLKEFRRIIRPGGLVALKDLDGTATTFQPSTPTLWFHLWDPYWDKSTNAGADMRGTEFAKYLRAAGFVNIQQRTFLVERHYPLRPVEVQFLRMAFGAMASRAERLEMPAEDLQVWQSLRDFDSPNHIFNNLDFYGRESQFLAIGQAP